MDILKVYHHPQERRDAFRKFQAERKFHHTCKAITESGDCYIFACVRVIDEAERFAGLRFDVVSISNYDRITNEAVQYLLIRQRSA